MRTPTRDHGGNSRVRTISVVLSDTKLLTVARRENLRLLNLEESVTFLQSLAISANRRVTTLTSAQARLPALLPSAMFVGWCSSIDDSTDTERTTFDSFFDDWCPDFGNTTRYDQDNTFDLPGGFLTIREEEEHKHDHIYTTSQEDEMVMSGSMPHQDDEWLLDSGATCGVTYDRNLMTDMRDRKSVV